VERLHGDLARVVPVFVEELDRPVAAVYEAGPTGAYSNAEMPTV
jgi:hypothetical protein